MYVQPLAVLAYHLFIVWPPTDCKLLYKNQTSLIPVRRQHISKPEHDVFSLPQL